MFKMAFDEITSAAIELGFERVSSDQRAALEAFMNGSDVFVCLPTGSGKSLCYWALPTLFDRRAGKTDGSIVIVVSPLHALMKDQIESLTRRSVSAAYAEKTKSDAILLDRIAEGKYQFVYISPEMLLTDQHWRNMIVTPVYKQNLIAFVVDEAHCVKTW